MTILVAVEYLTYVCLLFFLAFKLQKSVGTFIKIRFTIQKKKETHSETVTKHAFLAQTDIQGNILTCASCFFKYLH